MINSWTSPSPTGDRHVYLLLGRKGRRGWRCRNTVLLLPPGLIWYRGSAGCTISDWKVRPFPFHRLLRTRCTRLNSRLSFRFWLVRSVRLPGARVIRWQLVRRLQLVDDVGFGTQVVVDWHRSQLTQLQFALNQRGYSGEERVGETIELEWFAGRCPPDAELVKNTLMKKA